MHSISYIVLLYSVHHVHLFTNRLSSLWKIIWWNHQFEESASELEVRIQKRLSESDPFGRRQNGSRRVQSLNFKVLEELQNGELRFRFRNRSFQMFRKSELFESNSAVFAEIQVYFLFRTHSRNSYESWLTDGFRCTESVQISLRLVLGGESPPEIVGNVKSKSFIAGPPSHQDWNWTTVHNRRRAEEFWKAHSKFPNLSFQ